MAVIHNIKDNKDEAEVTQDLLEQADEAAVMESFVMGRPVAADVAQRVQDRARRVRERVYREHGLVDIGVPAIRELRGALP